MYSYIFLLIFSSRQFSYNKINPFHYLKVCDLVYFNIFATITIV